MYNVELFPIPRPYVFEGQDMVKIPGLDGSGKMGKSEGNAISLADSPQVIRKKVMKAVTDSGPTAPNQPKPEVIQNLFTLLNVVSAPDVVNHFDHQYNDCSIRYGDLKKQLAEDIITFTSPIREKIEALLADDLYLSKVAKLGAEKARASASRTLQEVREVIGVKKFY
jgi:tryptophanyl-tRNA synthetase